MIPVPAAVVKSIKNVMANRVDNSPAPTEIRYFLQINYPAASLPCLLTGRQAAGYQAIFHHYIVPRDGGIHPKGQHP